MLIQLIGPQNCGKSELRKRMCPGAVNIGNALCSMFNGEMYRAPGYYFDADDVYRSQGILNKLKEWMAGELICIRQQGQEVQVSPNPGIWIVESRLPIDFEGSMIWEVDKCL